VKREDCGMNHKASQNPPRVVALIEEEEEEEEEEALRYKSHSTIQFDQLMILMKCCYVIPMLNIHATRT
jgi:hypothetical protein